MPLPYYLAALDTILAVVLTMGLGGYVGYLRGKLKVPAPATTGHPLFEQGFRAHMNTIENLVLMLPLLWVASVFFGGQIPFWMGLTWVIGRIVFAVGYMQTDPRWREPGFGISFLALLGLLGLSILGVL